MKRILALILSAVLMLSISVPAYATGDENIIAARGEKQALAYRLKQLERLQKEVVDLETWAAEHLQAIGIPAWMASVYP